MNIGSLFSGYGGLDMGVRAAVGGDVAWVCEFDANPAAILKHHHPDVPNLGDITKVAWDTVEPVDILTGGFPCQDVSHAGRRAGLIRGGDGQTRSGLWGHMLQAINHLRPALVVAENVRGLLSAEADSDVEPCPFCMGDGGASPLRALGAVLADLADIGYDAAWTGIRAADVGAPHGRFRVFILAWPQDAAPYADHRAGDGERARPLPSRGSADHGPLSLLPTPTVSDTNGAGQHGTGGADLRTAISLLPTPMTVNRTSEKAQTGRPTSGASRGGPSYGLEDVVSLLPTPAVNDMGASYTPETWDAWTARMKAAHGNGNGHGASLSIEALRMLPTPRAGDGDKGGPNQRGSSGDLMLPSAVMAMLPTPSAADGMGGHERRGGARGDELLLNGVAKEAHRNPVTFGQYAPAIARWETVLGRPAPNPTEPTGKGNAHRLSPAFVEWLMGLPTGHVTNVPGLTRNAQLKALGNGVVPQQAAVAIRHLLTIQEAAA